MMGAHMEKNALDLQTKTLRIAVEIGGRQVDQLGKPLEGSKFETLPLEGQKQSLRNEGAYLYLRNFWDQYGFLVRKLENEKADELHFFIPFLRSLTETYGELLFFLNQDTRTMVGVFVGNYLLFYSDQYRFFSPAAVYGTEYKRFLALAKNVLDSEQIVLPEEIDQLTYRALGKLGFNFPPLEQIFGATYFEPLSQKTFECWQKDTGANFYNKYYRVHSTYTHRSFINQTQGNTGTEIFWVMQFMYLIAQLMLELADAKLFDGAFESDYRKFSTAIGKAYPQMLQQWDKTKKK